MCVAWAWRRSWKRGRGRVEKREYEMTHSSILRQQERERRARIERARLECERIDLAETLVRADRQRTHDILTASQRWNYSANLQKLSGPRVQS